MPRTGRVKKKLVLPDPIYNNRLISKFTNCVMKNGKKTVAQKIVYAMLDILKEKGQEDPVKFLENCLAAVSPKVEVRPRRIGGAVYQVPVEVKGDRKLAIAIRLVLTYAKKRSSKEFHHFEEKLAAELLDISKGIGESIKKRDQIHKMAEANKAFAHLRW